MAHTSGWPSGTVRSEPRTASRSSAVLLAGHHGVDGGDADVAALPGGDGGVHPVDRPLVVGRARAGRRGPRRWPAARQPPRARRARRCRTRRVSACGRARTERTRVRHAQRRWRAEVPWQANLHRVPSVPRALITGVSGQDGSYLAELLRRPRLRGRRPGPRGRREPARRRVRARRRPPGARHAARRRRTTARPDELYHLAAPTFVPDSWEDPTETVAAIATATATLLAAARDGRPGHARVGLDLQRGLRRRGREPADRAQPDAPAHALRRGEARRPRPRGRDARALRALRVLGADLQPRVAAAARAVPHAQGHARRRRDQARPRARARARRPRRRARLVARRRRRARPRGWRSRRRRARRLRDRLGRRAHRARLRRRRLRRARPRLGGLRARRPGLRARARAGGAGGRPDARPRAPGLDARALLRGPRRRDGGRRPGGPSAARLPPAPWTIPS